MGSWGTDNLGASRQLSFLDPCTMSLSDKLMSKAECQNLEFFVYFQSFHQVFQEKVYELVFIVDWEGAAADHDCISLKKLFDGGNFLEKNLVALP